jgi:DNA-binding transcriptional ArsR family regulator
MQPDLFTALDTMPAARSSDPATSHEAARELDRSGERRRAAMRALQAVRDHPGLTANELELVCGVTDGSIRKRLKELERMGLVRRGEVRVSGVSGKRNQTWWRM